MGDGAKLPVVLLVEDRGDDVLLVRRAFERGKLPILLFVVADGDEAILYLGGEGKFSDRTQYPVPDLVLLDLSLPGKDGFEVLHWIRAQPSLGSLRVIVLTASE